MSKRLSIWVLFLVMLGLSLSHLAWLKKDNGYLLVVDGREIDVLGAINQKWVAISRNCTNTAQLSKQDKSFLLAHSLVKAYSAPNSESAHIVSLWKNGGWLLAEVEFAQDALLPAVVLLKTAGDTASIWPQAIWSGYTQPWKAAPYIRQYLLKQGFAAPSELIECFEPQSRAFK